ncbi:MAG: chorismate lyase [Magnetococcales bacterium]|nr:chorismate lyase [Magnetococcales bacterium]
MCSHHTLSQIFSGVQFLDSWQEPEHLLATKGRNLVSSLRDLLSWRGSLTQRLEQHCGAKVTLRLINQHRVTCWPSEPDFWNNPLPLESDFPLLIRNAWLMVDDTPLVFAHSQIVLHNIPEAEYRSIREGSQPLGYLFMANKGQLARTHLQLNVLSLDNLARFSDSWKSGPCWCRRSFFLVNDVLLARILEIFPPTWPPRIKSNEVKFLD